MKAWEVSRNIIAYFQSFPEVDRQPFSFFSMVVSQNRVLYQNYRGSFDNPEVKSDPMEVLEEVIDLLTMVKSTSISIELMTNVDYESSTKHQIIYEEYLIPMLKILSGYAAITQMTEYPLDLLSLQGLYQHHRGMIPDVVNTVISV